MVYFFPVFNLLQNLWFRFRDRHTEQEVDTDRPVDKLLRGYKTSLSFGMLNKQLPLSPLFLAVLRAIALLSIAFMRLPRSRIARDYVLHTRTSRLLGPMAYPQLVIGTLSLVTF